jgi:GxxExxY protein
MSAAYRVHSRLGPGLFEKPYKECLYHELRRDNVSFESEKLLPVEYGGIIIPVGYKIDLLVENAVVVEIKSVENILPVHEQQLLTYLRLSRKRVGLLINFNVKHLKEGVRRRLNGY